jgi:hypothetical protein
MNSLLFPLDYCSYAPIFGPAPRKLSLTFQERHGAVDERATPLRVLDRGAGELEGVGAAPVPPALRRVDPDSAECQ